MRNDLFFNLFANCIPVKGHKRSIICDLGRNRFRYIPNSLYFILTKFKKKNIKEIKEKFNNEYNEFIDDYFFFLEKNEFVHYCTKEELNFFPTIKLEFEHPSTITNAIIDINKKSRHNYKIIFFQLGKLNCYYWQLRFFDTFNSQQLYDILSNIKTIHVRSLHLIIKFSSILTERQIKKIYANFPISRIDFYSTPKQKIRIIEKAYKEYPIYFYETIITNETHCGKINSDYFQLNILQFSESQKHNTCLNRKIGIDVNGEIKNCPSMTKSYGNIKNTTLLQAFKAKGFKDVWNINKDQIKVCKDCEFRHICTDCRAYIENPDDIHSKPLKCGYNPYTTKWEEWSVNPLKQEAIEYYALQELVNQ